MEKYNIPESNSLDSMEGDVAEDISKTRFNEGYRLGKKEGKYESWQAMVHDYSKDIGPIFSKISEFQAELLDRIQSAINFLMTLRDALPEDKQREADDVITKLDSLRIERFDGFKNTRFMQSELILDTRGVYSPEPLELVKQLSENGTLKDVCEITEVLVQHFIQPDEVEKKIRAYKKWAPEKNPAEDPLLMKLFFFDIPENDYTLDFQKRLNEKLSDIYLNNNGSIRELKKPLINNGVNLNSSDSILWRNEIMKKFMGDSVRTRFHQLVYSLRFAFQSAWAKTVLDSNPTNQFNIEISGEWEESKPRTVHIVIKFPLPVEYNQEKDLETVYSSVPYHATWKRKIEKFQQGLHQKKPEFFVDENNMATIKITSSY
ncbi:hypothetical protein IT397_01735 [Candidatus Nomurabacteria bacterium]|nr:hypothetical protein [Candidatus Nomurabacteria bacterium]